MERKLSSFAVRLALAFCTLLGWTTGSAQITSSNPPLDIDWSRWSNPEAGPVPVEFTKEPIDLRPEAGIRPLRTNTPLNHLTFTNLWDNPNNPGSPLLPIVPLCELTLQASTNWPNGGNWFDMTNWPTNSAAVTITRTNLPDRTLFRSVVR